MTSSQSPAYRKSTGSRILHGITGPRAGATVVTIAALHGNEPAGIAAVQDVFRQVPALDRGEWIGLIGNRTATELGVRFVDRDLNRRWESPVPGNAGLVEDHEHRELLATLETIFARARGPIYLIDLHTTSGPGKPFTVFADTLRSRALARALPVPMVLGLDEHLDGALVDYVAGLGHAAIVIEGGTHTDPASVHNLAGAVLLTMQLAGLTRFPGRDMTRVRKGLRRSVRGIPRVLEISGNHPVAPGDGFRMHPGFASFDRIQKGQLVAHDGNGEIRTPRSGLLLMPLYQAQGEDGFFVVRRVWRGWLALSHWLRRAGADRVVPYLPGVRPVTPDGAFEIDRRIARWGALELTHLLGYRREVDEGRYLRIRRRKHDGH